MGVKADVTIQLEIPVTASRLRVTSNQDGPVHLGEIRAYNVNPAGYPAAMSKTADTDVPGLENFARESGTRITASAPLSPGGEKALAHLNDGNPATRWTSQREGAKWVEIDFDGEKTLGCIQFLNGYESKGKWQSLLGDYKVQYHNGTAWIDMMDFNVADSAVNLARDFHTYGLEWTEKELVFYFNGKELRREKNEFCYSPAPVWLSLAIIAWAGNITDAIHGTAMEVDYVRIFEAKKPR
jgi:hypothetical protein